MRHFFTLLLVASNAVNIGAQSYFEQIWGDTTKTEKGIAVRQLNDGSVYLLGYDAAGDLGNGDATVTKLDAAGNVLWHKYYGTHFSDSPTSFNYHNGEFVITGETHLNAGNSQAFIQRIDTAGGDLGIYFYGGNFSFEQFNSIAYDNGSWVAVGFHSDDLGSNNVYVVRFDGNDWQNPEWTKSFGAAGNLEVGAGIIPLQGGGYIVVGDIMQHLGMMHTYVLRLDNRGDLVWEHTVLFGYNGGSKAAIINSQNQLVIIGEAATAFSAYFDVYFTRMQIDTPIILQNNTIPASNKGDAGFQIYERNANDYVVVGYGFNEPEQHTDVIFTAIDSLGVEHERMYMGSPSYDIATGLFPEINGNGFWITGSAGTQYFLAYQNIDNVLSAVPQIGNSDNDLLPYPNPCLGTLYLPEMPADAKLSLFNTQGQLCWQGQYQQYISLNHLPAGAYWLQCTDKEKIRIYKIVVSE